MNQLIKITSVPIQYELKINNARLEYSRSRAELEISRNDGGLSIKSRPVKLNLDSTEARNSVVPTTARSVAQTAQAGKEAAYSATAQMAQEGHLLLNAKIGEDVIGQIMQAILSGKYDLTKTAVLISQTGGGCRASNYIGFIRRALEKAGHPEIPVISINLSGLEKNPGFRYTPKIGRAHV